MRTPLVREDTVGSGDARVRRSRSLVLEWPDLILRSFMGLLGCRDVGGGKLDVLRIRNMAHRKSIFLPRAVFPAQNGEHVQHGPSPPCIFLFTEHLGVQLQSPGPTGGVEPAI